MRDVAIVAFAQHHAWKEDQRNEVEFLQPVIKQVLDEVGLTSQDMGFVVSGSSDYLAGQAFAFVSALDAVGPWPPVSESHVEMDGAWALAEAHTRLQHGDIDTAMVYSFGKSSPGDLPRVLSLQLDPYSMAPLWPDSVSLAGLQARALLERNGHSREDLAEVVARSRRHARDNPYALRRDEPDASVSDEPWADPLSRQDCAPVNDGAAAMVLMAGDRAREYTDSPVWIRGIDHRIEPMQLGLRDLSVSESTRLAAERAGVGDGPIDLAELHAPFSSQELILAEALGLDEQTVVNPSGGALASNPMMAAGLVRLGEAATRVAAGDGGRAVAHATSGPCLQQNLVCVLEAEA